MTAKETNIRSVLFLIIGILLLLSLIICVHIVSEEKDLVQTEAKIIDIKNDSVNEDEYSLIVVYEVNGVQYEYTYITDTYKEVNNNVVIYYNDDNPALVQTFKTNKNIFLCPVIGIILCIFGLFELFKKDNDEISYNATVIGEIGNTQQFKIINNEEVDEYVKTHEEEVETSVKKIKKK